MLCHLRQWVLGFHFPVYWHLDPFRDTTDEDSKYLHNALQIRELSPPLSHLILSMTLSGRKGRLCCFFLFLAACRILVPHAFSVVQSCLTLCDPMDCSLPGPSVHKIFQARILEGLPFPPPGDLPDSGTESEAPVSPALQVDSLPTEPLAVNRD